MRSRLERFASLRDVLSSPQLRRLELSYAGFYASDWIHFVAVSVYAYAHGGATSVGIYGLVRMSAAAVAAPFGGVFVDRYPRQRALLAIHGARAAALAAVATALASGWPEASVFALAALVSLCGGPFRPAHLAMLPSLAETPQQLVAANVTSTVFEGGAVLAGPALAGGLLAVTTPATVVAVGAGVSLWAALLVVRLGRDRDWARRRSSESVLGETMAGLRTLRREPHTGLVIGLLASQAFTRGLMNVLVVSASIQFLRAGGSGVGWLNSGLGVGGLVGGLASVRLVGRRRLATPLAFALAAWSAPLAALAAWPELGWAYACMAVVGAANAFVDVSGYTLLQRTTDDAVLGRVFGVFEILNSGSVAAGSIVAPGLLDALDVRGALVVAGAFLPAVAVVFARRLRAIDASIRVPQAEVDLLRSIPVFRPLAVTVVERLADHLVAVRAAAGEEIVHEGDVGDRFFVIAAGAVDVRRDGELLETLHAGDYFGEIALLRDVPRVATCSAATAVELLALERDVFVAAVTGNLRSASTVERVASRRLAGRGRRGRRAST